MDEIKTTCFGTLYDGGEFLRPTEVTNGGPITFLDSALNSVKWARVNGKLDIASMSIAWVFHGRNCVSWVMSMAAQYASTGLFISAGARSSRLMASGTRS